MTLQMLRTHNDVTWSYLAPAGNFLEGEATGAYLLGGEEMVRAAEGQPQGILYADFARAVIDELERRDNVGKLFNALGTR